jgi:MRG-binding protein
MDNLKPVGINKHFFMALIVERLSKALKRDISSNTIWSHLETMYNLKTLDSQESLPFPNEETIFSLPEPEYVLVKREVEEPKIKVEPKSEPAPRTCESIL